jgi:hypothetical protein
VNIAYSNPPAHAALRALLILSLGVTRLATASEMPSREPTPEAPSPAETPAALLRHQSLIESYRQDTVHVARIEDYFAHVFALLPSEVRVYPSENYYYFSEAIAGRNLRGNLRLAAGRREKGILSFWYEEVRPMSGPAPDALGGSKEFTASDGLQLAPADSLTWIATYRQKSVTFHLHPLPQDPPRQFPLRTNEVFVMRTFDESGIQFFLLFDTAANCFFWVLNQEAPVPEHFDRLAPDLMLGRRTGFAFWQDAEQPPRLVLASVYQASVDQNDFADGPFDQLADNDADQTRIAWWMERADPRLHGKIDRFGYYTDGRPGRVALTTYGTHRNADDVTRFVARAKASANPHRFISRAGQP